jgi:FHA domain
MWARASGTLGTGGRGAAQGPASWLLIEQVENRALARRPVAAAELRHAVQGVPHLLEPGDLLLDSFDRAERHRTGLGAARARRDAKRQQLPDLLGRETEILGAADESHARNRLGRVQEAGHLRHQPLRYVPHDSPDFDVCRLRYLFDGQGCVHAHACRLPETEICHRPQQTCDIRIKEPTVSGLHCEITRLSPGGFLLQDSGAKNGVHVYHPLDGGNTWRKVATTHLTVGLHILLGDVRLLVTDHRGYCRIAVDRYSEFCRQALYYYGTPHAAARITGAPRRLIARIARGLRR